MKNNKVKKTMGIIGGMGPFASARLLELVLEISRDKFGTNAGDEFPRISLVSLPIKEFFLDEELTRLAFEQILMALKAFEDQKISCFGIACNTAHLLEPEIKSVTKLRMVSIIDETIRSLKESGVKQIGLMASPITISSKLFETKLTRVGVEVIRPNSKQIKMLGLIIGELVSGHNKLRNKIVLENIALDLKKRGAEAIVLGCTELPLAFPANFELPVFNTLEILANSLVERCYISN